MSNPRSYAPSLPGRRLLAALALAGLLFACLSLAQQQGVTGQSTSTSLVDNRTQTATATGRDLVQANYDMAQAFTTGPNSGGYTLTSVKIRFVSVGSTAPTFTVKVCTGSDSAPDTTCSGTLTTPTMPSSGGAQATHEFTHGSGIDLNASTTYYLVLVTTAAGTGGTSVSTTNSDSEDSGGASGWSIANSLLAKSHTSGSSWTSPGNDSWKFQVLGTIKTSTPPTGSAPAAAPTGLTTTAGPNGITLNWNDPGDSSIVRYEYSLDGSTWISIPNSGPGTTSHTIAGVTSGTVRLRAVNADGAGRATSRQVVPRERVVLVAVYDTAGWARFKSRFGENCWDEHDAAVAAARTSSGRTPEDDELARCQRFLAEDIRDVEYVRRVVR